MTGDQEKSEPSESTGKVDPRFELSFLADELRWITGTMQKHGSYILFATLFSCLFCTISVALVVRLGLEASFVPGGGSVRTVQGYFFYRIFFAFPLAAIMSAVFAVMFVVKRDSVVRHGQAMVEVLIEESERTSFSMQNNDNAEVRVAIRSFNHLKTMPLSGERSSGGVFAFVSIFSLLASIAAALFMI